MNSCESHASQAIIVLGMHRSGTSALTGVLSIAGADPGPMLMPAVAAVNPKGFWEHHEIVRVHDRLLEEMGFSWDDERPLPDTWWRQPALARFRRELCVILERDFLQSPLWILKDPRLCRLLPLWLDILSEYQVAPHFVLCLRHPIEVAMSLEKRDGLSRTRACLLYLEHLLDSERWSRSYPRVLISYEQLLSDWRTALQSISETLPIFPRLADVTAQSIESFLEPSLRHHERICGSPISDDAIQQLALKAYESVLNQPEGELGRILDPVACDTATFTRVAGPYIDEVRAMDGKRRYLESKVSELLAENTSLRLEATSIKRTASWRLTSPLRLGTLLWKRRNDVRMVLIALVRRKRLMKLFSAGFKLLWSRGPRFFLRSLRNFILGNLTYERWISQNDVLDNNDISAIERHIASFIERPLISVLLPVYNTPEPLLRRAIESVRTQIYPDWELCIADDASTEPYVWPLLLEFADLDKRIKITQREENGHISAASNSCLELARGEYAALLDHDDELSAHALYLVVVAVNEKPGIDIIYSDEDKIDEEGRRSGPYFKPDWNPDLFMAQNMVSHLGVYRTSLMRGAGAFRTGYEGSQDWDLALRISELIPSSHVCHIPHVLYHWRTVAGSTATTISEKPYAVEAGLAAVRGHIERTGRAASVGLSTEAHLRVKFRLPDPCPLVSLIISAGNDLTRLRSCIETLRSKTDYSSVQTIIVTKPSCVAQMREYLNQCEIEGIARIISLNDSCGSAAANNAGAKAADGDVLCFLSSYVEIIDPGWLEEMVSQALRNDIGVVGAMLYYPDDTIRHASYILGHGSLVGDAYASMPRGIRGYMNRACLVQNVSAVCGSCMAVRKEVFSEVGGFDETRLPSFLYDVDFCLRVLSTGCRNLWTPYAELYDHESSSRTGRKLPHDASFDSEKAYLISRWKHIFDADPAYNPNLTLVGSWPYMVSVSRTRKPWLMA